MYFLLDTLLFFFLHVIFPVNATSVNLQTLILHEEHCLWTLRLHMEHLSDFEKSSLQNDDLCIFK